ncbi:MAG: hypothetical protein WEG40_05470 [Candidatus Rokuibacteriota bacterium]
MIGRCCLVVVIALSVLAGCSSERERQWYKPAANYTVAEFQRDRDQCTKDNVLDEQCLKRKGWVPLSGDREPADAPKAAPNPRGPRY